jgi:protein gp37
MGSKTKIPYVDSTWNPVTGCSPISEGCEHCYACAMAKRFPKLHGFLYGPTADGEGPEKEPVPFRTPRLHADRLDAPTHWRNPRRIFVCSMGDLFHEDVADVWIDVVLCAASKAQQHTYLFLTKRPTRMRDALFAHSEKWYYGGATWPQNWWMGVTAENQQRADERIPALLEIPAAVHFVSVEPMLGSVDLSDYLSVPCRACNHPGNIVVAMNKNGRCSVCDGKRFVQKPKWVICGGETGPGAREMKSGWAISLARECDAVGVPFFFKKWGSYSGSETGTTRSERREFPK